MAINLSIVKNSDLKDKSELMLCAYSKCSKNICSVQQFFPFLKFILDQITQFCNIEHSHRDYFAKKRTQTGKVENESIISKLGFYDYRTLHTLDI